MMNYIDLLNSNNEAIDVFVKNAKLLDGEIDVVIHPFYSDSTEVAKNNRYAKKPYLDNIKPYIEKLVARRKPFLIFQEDKTYSTLADKLSFINTGNIYTIRTLPGQHYLLEGSSAWDKLIDILNSSKIETVLLSGMYLVNSSLEKAVKEHDNKYDEYKTFENFIEKRSEYAEFFPCAREWIKRDIAVKGCVGYAAMEFLASGIDVRISKVTTPCSQYETL